MAQTAVIKITVRTGNLAQWNGANPVLLRGEIGLVHDAIYPLGFVFGNGADNFDTLWASNAFKFTPDANWQLAINALALTLNNALTAEAITRANADIATNNALNAEIALRDSQVSTLTTNLSAEVAARINGDAALNNYIASVEANAAEVISALETNIQNWYGTALNTGDILSFNSSLGTFEILSVGLAGQLLSVGTLGEQLEWVDPPTGAGDMVKSVYDTDNDGIVNAADVAYEVDWADVTNKPVIGTGDMVKAVYDTDNDGVVDAAEREQILVKNGTGATLTKGTIVYIKSSSTSAAHPEVLKADASTEATSSKTMGAVYEDISNGDLGYIVTSGQVHNLNTSAYTVGTKLWLATVPGQVTNVPPTQPFHTVFIGFVTRSQVNNGGVVYAIQNGYEIGELHDVLLNAPATGDVLYNDGSGLWTNNDIPGILGYTPADVDLVEPLIAPGTTSDYWRGDKAWATLDKAAVGLSNVDNTSDANKPVSTATQTALNAKEPTISSGTTTQYWRGDKSWQTLNKNAVGLGNVDNTSDANKPVSAAMQTALDSKQGTLSLTTTGTSGPATLVGNTLNVPNYATGGGGVSAGEAIAYAIALG